MLDDIVASTRRRIPSVADRLPEWRSRAAEAPPVRDLVGSLVGPRLAVIAEIKRRSPSRGDLNRSVDPAAHALRYQRGGAAAVSILTEPDHFAGSDADLEAVRAAVSVPILRKDFTLHPAQIWEARALGADVVLLIVALLDDDDLRMLLETSGEAGVAALVEVHTPAEAERALAAGARVVGVNNRDLTTFDVSLRTAEEIAPLLSGIDVRVAESGIFGPDDAARMAAAGYQAVLVGERLVTATDPERVIEGLTVPR